MHSLRERFDTLSRKGRARLCAGLLVLGGVLALVLSSREPVEDGRSLTQCVEALAALTSDTPEWQRAASAIRAMRERSIPGLLRHLEGREPAWREPLEGVLGWLGVRDKTSLPGSSASLWRRSMGAAYAFEALGPQVSAAVPAITNLLQVSTRRLPAALALAGIGEAGIPPLCDLAGGTNEVARKQVAVALGQSNARGPAAINLLVGLLQDPDSSVRMSAGWSLATKQAAPERVVPRLAAGLATAKQREQEAALSALGLYGQQAQSALPMLDRLGGDDANPLAAQARAAARSIRQGAPLPPGP